MCGDCRMHAIGGDCIRSAVQPSTKVSMAVKAVACHKLHPERPQDKYCVCSHYNVRSRHQGTVCSGRGQQWLVYVSGMWEFELLFELLSSYFVCGAKLLCCFTGHWWPRQTMLQSWGFCHFIIRRVQWLQEGCRLGVAAGCNVIFHPCFQACMLPGGCRPCLFCTQC
jgi:hypothetical protein